MYKSDLGTSGHRWTKKNLVTKMGRKGGYDEMECEACGMQGKRYNFTEVEVSEKYKKENVELCPLAEKKPVARKVKVIFCTAHGEKFSNLTPDSIHEVVTPPDPYVNDHTGVWVMGVGQPVKLLTGEFIPID